MHSPSLTPVVANISRAEKTPFYAPTNQNSTWYAEHRRNSVTSSHQFRSPSEEGTVMSSSGFSSSLMFLLLLIFLTNVSSRSEASIAQANGSLVEVEELVPLLGQRKVEMVLNESRRKLGGFQICALCTCCGGARGVCVPSPCCYAINCHIPNRPYGFCSFTPKTCHCFGCH